MARTRANTEDLKPGDFVVGSERAEIMIPPQGLYVERIQPHLDARMKPTGGIMVFWRGNKNPEVFNPYWTWYLGEPKPETPSDPIESAKTELKKLTDDLDFRAAMDKWLDDRNAFMKSRFEEFSKTQEWVDAATKYPNAVASMTTKIQDVFIKEFALANPIPKQP